MREDIQVIVVDDCSPCQEDVFRMLEELNRPYLEYYSTSKGGSAGRARNVGLDHAKGKWLVFADADDFFVENVGQMLDEHINDIEDVIYFNNGGVLSEDLSIENNRDSRSLLFENFKKDGNESSFRYSCPTPWGKMVSRDLVSHWNIRFDETYCSNDYYFSVLVGLRAVAIRVVDEILYIVTERADSLSSILRDNSRIVSAEECQIRLSVALRVSSLLKREKVSFSDTTYLHYAMLYLHSHPSSFCRHLMYLFFKYPLYTIEIVRHWYFQKRNV